MSSAIPVGKKDSTMETWLNSKFVLIWMTSSTVQVSFEPLKRITEDYDMAKKAFLIQKYGK